MADAIRAARESRAPLRIQGAGTWLDAGRPVRAGATLSLAADRGIVEYVPGDLTLTARAGTPLPEIEQATLVQGQWLPLAPWGRSDAGRAGTLGATISTATAGPYAAAFGLPRDVVLGLEFVTGGGDVVRSGGRVVKNVAGFDLTRLLTGSWGTLGVITEVTVRLRALPAVSRTLAVNPATAPSAIADLSRAVRELPFAPFACELISRGMAQRLGLASRVTLLVRLGGNAVAVAAQTDAFRALGAVSDVPDEIWHALRAADSESVATWRWSARPARFAGLWRAAHELRQDEVLAHGSPARGVVRLIGLGGSAARLASAPPPEAGGVVVERLAPQEWGAVPLPPPDPLARAVRERFDPDGVLNPGILGDFS